MRARTSKLVSAVVAAGFLVASAGPAGAAQVADAPVPASTALVVTGNGFGHGHGMSQYGAKGAATSGLTYQQILAFYYQGTALAPLSASIKVLVTGDSDNNTTVLPAAGLRVRDLGNGRTYRLSTQNTPRLWRLVRLNGHTKVFYRTSRWHLYRTGGRRWLAGDGEFRSSSGVVTLKLASGNRPYRGALRYTNRDTVNVLSMENYLKGVIASEMPASWPAAALQAQAVAARTYAARARADNLGRYYQICDTTRCQVYGGVLAEQAPSSAAVAATAGQVLTYGGKYAFAQFASSSGGWTSDGGQPYLTSHEDPYDLAASPHHHWKVTVDTAKLQAAHPEIGTLTQVQIMQRENTGTAAEWGGWVQIVRLSGIGGATPFVDISGSELRSIYRLRSAYFTFDTVT